MKLRFWKREKKEHYPIEFAKCVNCQREGMTEKRPNGANVCFVCWFIFEHKEKKK